MSTFICRTSCLMIALIGSFLLSGSAFAQSGLEKKIEELGQPYIDSETVVGMSIGVIKDGKVTTVSLGVTKKDGPVPNNRTVYEIGSISKVFTGLLLADAANSKTVTLDQSAQSLLPKGVTMPKWKDREITLLDLSTHSSGLPRLSDNMPSIATGNPYSDYSSKLAHEFLNKHEMQQEPGKYTGYSNFGVSLLGHLISSRSEKSYDKLLQERISKPLGMHDTRVALTDSMKERLAMPHSASGEQDHNWDFADMPGAGGIRSTLGDMILFAQANLKTPDSQVGSALNLAWKKHRDGQPAMGLGWHFAGDGHTRWHNGQTGGYHSMMMVDREKNTAIVVLCNSAAMEVDQLAQQIAQTLAGQSVKPRKFEKEFVVSDEIMQRYVGEYQLAPTFVFTVSVKNKKLMVGVTGQSTQRVYARSETEWYYKVVDASITFKVNEAGECTALVLHQNGLNQTAARK